MSSATTHYTRGLETIACRKSILIAPRACFGSSARQALSSGGVGVVAAFQQALRQRQHVLVVQRQHLLDRGRRDLRGLGSHFWDHFYVLPF